MHPFKRITIFSIVVASLTACNNSAPTTTSTATGPDFLAANIDSSVRPGDDFFQFANGGWIKKTPIPAAEGAWGIGNLVQEEI